MSKVLNEYLTNWSAEKKMNMKLTDMDQLFVRGGLSWLSFSIMEQTRNSDRRDVPVQRGAPCDGNTILVIICTKYSKRVQWKQR